nr:hypothetical protein [Tanacetum cinerariifolium]
DDESLSDEDVPEDNVKIYSNLLFEFDDEYISSDINPLFDEVLEDIDCKDSYDSNLDESTFVVTPLFDYNENEYFTPVMTSHYPMRTFRKTMLKFIRTFFSNLMTNTFRVTSSDVNPLFDEVLEDIDCKESYDSNLDESTFVVTPLFDYNENEYFTPGDDVELLHHRDPSTPIMSVVFILEGFTNEPPLEENDDLFNLESKKNEWKKILYDTPIDDLMTEDKVFDPTIHEQIFSPTYVSLPFTDRPYLLFTYVVLILLLYFIYPVDSPFLLSSKSEDTIFDLGIFAFHFSHRSGTSISFNVYPNILNESPMEICSSTVSTLISR